MSFDDIPAFVSRLQTSKYVIAASLVILIINYIDTFSEEYELIWKSKWGAAKVLFLFSRYIAFAEMLLTMCLYNDAEMQYDVGIPCFLCVQLFNYLFFSSW
ncbi:hypothetical protein SERLADRAFT_459585 [Serpula lacrymans var. lacrymans S7.9]|uniref:DUF6533 domain-containing protein n=1 Tax=Serpula lacrymans var. lacrymans (strain S7.9) TaxID=578457 RepID=F8NKL2_SERL9|nr:uncharacterized protein SERLADRAFT_459585 [Serpula lacrymans var. lacrymans S7.9]EGO28784.1 hypothetical protein SERLADRAFT_459585 [Serpula lacrymans var. lacrymans S7.9]